MTKVNPYLRIMRAAAKGKGVKLSAEEVWHLSHDSAIATVATNLETGEEMEAGGYRLTPEGFENTDELCPDCANGRLRPQIGGGVKCDGPDCIYWFCY